MKKTWMLAIAVVMLLVNSSCNDEIPEGYVRGGDGELIEVATVFDMAEFLNDVYMKGWRTKGVYERNGDKIGDNIYADAIGYYGTLYRFTDTEMHSFINCTPLITSGVPVSGEQWIDMEDAFTIGTLKLYHNLSLFITDETNNTLSFSANNKWEIVGYSSENIIIDYTKDGEDYRLILQSNYFPEYLNDTDSKDMLFTDWIEYYEKYDPEFVAAATDAYEDKDYMQIEKVAEDYFAKWGRNFNEDYNTTHLWEE